MKKTSNYRDVWDSTSQSEKERIYNMFLREYGTHCTTDDFVKFLKKRYKVSDKTPTYTHWRQGF